ncbi:MAG: hypothetical protein QM831_00615 [Kofleriaceae bacterium]
MRVLLVLLIVARAARAYATGECENNPVRFDPPELYNAKLQAFAIPVSAAWCDFQDDNMHEAARGTVSFVELRDIRNKVIGRITAATGKDLEREKAMMSDIEVVAQLHKTLLARGYQPIKNVPACSFKAKWDGFGDKSGWQTARVSLDVAKRKKLLTSVLVGEGSAARQGDAQIRAATDGTVIAVFVTVPTCAGPPPGYFGPEDGGDCYHVDEPLVRLLAAETAKACLAK